MYLNLAYGISTVINTGSTGLVLVLLTLGVKLQPIKAQNSNSFKKGRRIKLGYSKTLLKSVLRA